MQAYYAIHTQAHQHISSLQPFSIANAPRHQSMQQVHVLYLHVGHNRRLTVSLVHAFSLL